MPFPAAARDYLLKALDATPVVLTALLRRADPDWDHRPDADRFTLREALAHLADWEPIWLERVRGIASGEHPLLPSVDESALAIENRYAESSPEVSLDKFRSGRKELVAYLATLPDSAWDFTGDREFVGELTLQQQAAFALSHDGYHLRQVAEWLQR